MHRRIGDVCEGGSDSRFELSSKSLVLPTALFGDQNVGVVGNREASRLVEYDDVVRTEIGNHAGHRSAERLCEFRREVVSVSRQNADRGCHFGAARKSGATFAACPDHVGVRDGGNGLQVSPQGVAQIVIFELFELLVTGEEVGFRNRRSVFVAGVTIVALRFRKRGGVASDFR